MHKSETKFVVCAVKYDSFVSNTFYTLEFF